MAEMQLALPDEGPCFHCDHVFPMIDHVCPNCQTPAARLNYVEFFAQVERGFIMDARFGGLVLGDPGPEDYIPMYRNVSNGIFQVVGLMHGWEYILSTAATDKHRVTLERINSETGPTPQGFDLPTKPITTINTNLMPRFCGVWISSGGQFVINSYATSRHLEVLEEINSLCTRNALYVEWRKFHQI